METWARSKGNKNTKVTYKPYAKEYLKWCGDRELPSEDPVVLSAFLRYLVEVRKLSRGTINNTVTAAVADLFRFSKFSPTQDPLVLPCKKTVVKMTNAPEGKKPLPRSLLEDMVAKATPCEQDIRDIFMFILMFGGLLRESETAGLTKEEVWIVVDEIQGEVLYIFINKSKMDQEKRGETVVLAACPGSPLCPVKWFKLYTQVARSTEFFFHSTFAIPDKLSKTAMNLQAFVQGPPWRSFFWCLSLISTMAQLRETS